MGITVDAGSLIQGLSILGACLAAVWKVSSVAAKFESKVEALDDSFQVYIGRLDNVVQRLAHLEGMSDQHGKRRAML